MADRFALLLRNTNYEESNGGASLGVGVWHGEVAKRSNAADCKSVALAASEVRILPSPPAFARAEMPRALRPGRLEGAQMARALRLGKPADGS